VQQTNDRREDGVLYDVLGNGATTHVAGRDPQQRALVLVVSAITPLTCENCFSIRRPDLPSLYLSNVYPQGPGRLTRTG
jgi:hypothetical protein